MHLIQHTKGGLRLEAKTPKHLGNIVPNIAGLMLDLKKRHPPETKPQIIESGGEPGD